MLPLTVVVNKRTHKPSENDVYIGRPSMWGNPYIIGRDGLTRDAAVARYRAYMRNKVLRNPAWMRALQKLQGKTLICYCKPHACHGDILVELIEEYYDE